MQRMPVTTTAARLRELVTFTKAKLILLAESFGYVPPTRGYTYVSRDELIGVVLDAERDRGLIG